MADRSDPPTREQVYRDIAPLVRRLVENHRARVAEQAALPPEGMDVQSASSPRIRGKQRSTAVNGGGLTADFETPKPPLTWEKPRSEGVW